jgi:hypothetical protein
MISRRALGQDLSFYLPGKAALSTLGDDYKGGSIHPDTGSQRFIDTLTLFLLIVSIQSINLTL